MLRPKPHTYAKNEPGRDTVRALLRRPVVQGVLALAAIGQGLAVAERPERAEEAGTAPMPTPVVALAPAVVTPQQDNATVAAAWEAAALEREAERMATRYREQGFPVTEDLAEDIHAAAVEHGIEPEIAFGLIAAESSFRNQATSRVGAVGLTQLMPATARWLEPGVTRSELRNPETNLRIGMRYLKQLIDKYEGDVDLALTAYNRGPGTVDRVLKRGGNPDNGYANFVKTGKKGRHKG